VLWNVEQRKPAPIPRREVVDCFDGDLACFAAGIPFDANLRVFKSYFVPANCDTSYCTVESGLKVDIE